MLYSHYMELKLSTQLKNYISEGQNDLLDEGSHLLSYVYAENTDTFDDYSFIVFPFAKAYEGFLKQVFFDAGYITRRDYYSQHFRVGKVLSPNLVRKLGNQSVYKKICDRSGCDLSEKIWYTWKKGRNEVFHYFPHNLHSLSLQEARDIIKIIVETMELVVGRVKLQKIQSILASHQRPPEKVIEAGMVKAI